MPSSAAGRHDAQLQAGRRRRLLAQLDKALARQGVKPPRRPARASQKTEKARLTARTRYETARASHGQLVRAVRAEGGISTTRDFSSRQIPREFRAKRGRGLAPDEMAVVLTSHGFHFDGDSELITAIQQRREHLSEAHEEARRVAVRHGPSVVCTENCRDPHGAFARCENAARQAVRICRERWRDVIGRFRQAPKPRRRR